MNRQNCPVCDRAVFESHSRGDLSSCKCSSCGDYKITGTAWQLLRGRRGGALLGSWIRFQNVLHKIVPTIDSKLLESESEIVVMPGVSERIEDLLLATTQLAPVGKFVNLSENHRALGWTEDPDEFHFLVDALKSSGDLEVREYSSALSVRVSPSGYMRVAARASRVSGTSAFVAMSFSDGLQSVYEDGIAPGIRDAGFDAVRVDKRPHNERIDFKIETLIRASRFVLADFTEQKNGVYYEAGFARGLGLPVIWTVRDTDIKALHFDTRQFAHVVWSDPKDLREKVRDAIGAIIGKP